MPIVGADGLPLDPEKRAESLPAGAGGNVLGYTIVKMNKDGSCVPLIDQRTGCLAVIGDPQKATAHAAHLANQELIPNENQKVVTPAQVSNAYMVLKLLAFGTVQAKLKDPTQLLAPEGKLNG